MPRLCRGQGYRYRSREIDVGQFGIKTFTPKKKELVHRFYEGRERGWPQDRDQSGDLDDGGGLWMRPGAENRGRGHGKTSLNGHPRV